MIKLLYIETATRVCSIAISKGIELLGLKETTIINSHAEMVSPFIEGLVKEQGWTYKDLDAIVVSKGPGSYTGLRIGVSSAKGLCYAMDIPLISVNTLQSMAFGMNTFIKNKSQNVLICPMIDARRMEVYTAIFDKNNNEVQKTKAKIIDKDSFKEYFENNAVYFAGDGAEKCKETFANKENAIFLDEFEISSKYMIEIANRKFNHKEFEDVAYFEPYYLKNFIAGKPKVKGLE